MIDDIAILWTGGWDSTYAGLDHVSLPGRTVAPHYVADPNRPSMPTELATMKSIRAGLAAQDAAAAARLRPLTVRSLSDVVAFPTIDPTKPEMRERAPAALLDAAPGDGGERHLRRLLRRLAR